MSGPDGERCHTVPVQVDGETVHARVLGAGPVTDDDRDYLQALTDAAVRYHRAKVAALDADGREQHARRAHRRSHVTGRCRCGQQLGDDHARHVAEQIAAARAATPPTPTRAGTTAENRTPA